MPRWDLPRSNGPPPVTRPRTPHRATRAWIRPVHRRRPDLVVCSRAPRRRRSPREAEQLDHGTVRRPVRGWRDGACGAARRSGPVATTSQPGPAHAGPRPAAWRGPRSRQDPRPQAQEAHTKHVQRGEGRRENTPDALRRLSTGLDAARARRTRPVGPVRRRARGWPGVDSLDGSSLSDLAAGHLQGPAKTRTTYTDHLLSLVIEKIAPTDDVP